MSAEAAYVSAEAALTQVEQLVRFRLLDKAQVGQPVRSVWKFALSLVQPE